MTLASKGQLRTDRLRIGLLRVSKYSDIVDLNIKSSMNIRHCRNRWIAIFFFLTIVTKLSIEIFPMTTVLINYVSHLNTFVSHRLVTCICTLHYR